MNDSKTDDPGVERHPVEPRSADSRSADSRSVETRSTESRAAEFVAALPSPRASGDRSDRFARLGMVIMSLGLAVTVVATVLSQTSDNPLDQSTQISLGITGLAATCFGGVIFLRYSLGELLRFWLLRMLHERETDRR
ncbi:MAG: hypothetical protein V9F03_11540 [Microthrixaceae bacterium]